MIVYSNSLQLNLACVPYSSKGFHHPYITVSELFDGHTPKGIVVDAQLSKSMAYLRENVEQDVRQDERLPA